MRVRGRWKEKTEEYKRLKNSIYREIEREKGGAELYIF